MMHGCGLAARCILRDHPSRSLARGHHHPSHLTLADSSHHRATSLVTSLVIAEHFPPSLETNFPPHGTVVSSSAASIRSHLAQVPSHEYGDVARVSAPAAAARRPGRRRSAGSPRTHSCRPRHDNGTAATLGNFDIDVLRNSQCSRISSPTFS